MGTGAVFGGINTMYAAVAARTREIATLRGLFVGSGLRSQTGKLSTSFAGSFFP